MSCPQGIAGSYLVCVTPPQRDRTGVIANNRGCGSGPMEETDVGFIPPLAAAARGVETGGGVLMGALILPIAGCGSGHPLTAGLARGTEPPTPFRFFLTPEERRIRRALVDRLIPGDIGPGAADADLAIADR